MLRFAPYPIVTINGTYRDEAERLVARVGHAFGIFNDAQKLDRLKQANRFDYRHDPSPAARRYEEQVRVLLNAMVRTEVGRCLFNFFKGGLPIWIIPYDSSMRQVFGGCNANAGFAVTEHLGGKPGVRVAYSPEDWSFSACGHYPGMRADEVLFHELVHAYRFASPFVPMRNNDPLPDNQDHEEFLATQITNVYRSMKGAQRFNRDYMSKLLGTADQAEQALWSRQELLDAIDGFLATDPMVQAVGRIRTPYNPFARIGELKKARAKSQPGAVLPHAGGPRPQPIP